VRVVFVVCCSGLDYSDDEQIMSVIDALIHQSIRMVGNNLNITLFNQEN
jgi:hypothetical protein